MISLLNKYLVEDHVVEKDGKVGRMSKQLLNNAHFQIIFSNLLIIERGGKMH